MKNKNENYCVMKKRIEYLNGNSDFEFSKQYLIGKTLLFSKNQKSINRLELNRKLFRKSIISSIMKFEKIFDIER
jgi:hypothetical protein